MNSLMARITFIGFDGTRHQVHGEIGTSIMEAGRNNGVPGIEAECGGCAACATCHVIVDDPWLAVTGAASSDERELLEFLDNVRAGSRLSCQIAISAEMDGIEVHVPEDQGV
jgi:2Fe-2S ferredoxin